MIERGNSITGLFWGELGERTSWVEYFLRSGNPYYMELGKRIRAEKTLEERLEYIPTGRYARYVKVTLEIQFCFK